MYTKRDFIEAYVIASITASSTNGAMLKPAEIVDEAVEAWDCIGAAADEEAKPLRALSRAKSQD